MMDASAPLRPLAARAAARLSVAPVSEGRLHLGSMVELEGRGCTYVIDVPGPSPDAPTIFLIHALGCTAHLSWYPSLGSLSKHFRVVAFDQRRHGRGIQSEHFRFADCADDVAALADVLGIDTFIVGGYSMGGAVAQLVWKRHRERVSGLVLAATARNFQGKAVERGWFSLTRETMRRFEHRAEAAALRAAAKLSPELRHEVADGQLAAWALGEFRSTAAWSMLAVLDELGQFDSSAWIGQVRVPTSVVIATHDKLIPTRRQHKLTEAIPLAIGYEFVGNHAGMVLGAERFVPVFLEACQSVARRSAVGREAPKRSA